MKIHKSNATPSFKSFEELVSATGSPIVPKFTRIELSEFGCSTSFPDLQDDFNKPQIFPLQKQEELERNQVFLLSQKCFEATSENVEQCATELVEAIKRAASQNEFKDATSDESTGDDFDELIECAGDDQDTSIQDQQCDRIIAEHLQIIASLTLAHAISISPTVGNILEKLVREENSLALITLGCRALSGADFVPANLAEFVVNRTSELFMSEEVNNREELLGVYLELISKTKELPKK